MKKISILVAVVLICLAPRVSDAQSDYSLKEVVVDAMYGGLAGALIGAATMTFEEKPSDHWEKVQVGVGVGVILGSLYGTVRVSRSLVELKSGTMAVQFPSLSIDPVASHEKGVLAWSIPLLSISD